MDMIGLTGGIGAGKSIVARMLRGQGYEVYDCDSEAKRIMDAADDLKEAIGCRFGSQCLNDDGSLNRRNIAECVFADDDHRLWLNAQVHGLVREDVAKRAGAAGNGILFVESAILRSSGLDRMCEEVWIVDAPESVRIDRAVSRDKSDSGRVKVRIEAQRQELDDFDVPVKIICNDGRTPLLPQIEKLLKQYKENA